MWKNMRLGGKFAIGFGAVLGLLAIVGGWSVLGVGTVVTNAGEVIDGNKLRAEMVQREVDHLNWVAQVNKLLTDETVTELTVQTDPAKCGFGKWFYGDGRREAEALVPGIAPYLREIEEHHNELHASAVEIGEVFKHADRELPKFLAEKEGDHLKWVNKVQALIAGNGASLDVQTDDHLCGLGKFIHGPEGESIAAFDGEMAKLLEDIKEPHRQLHASAIEIGSVWRQVNQGLVGLLKDRLDDHRRWVNNVADAIILGEKSLDVQMDHTECGFGKFLASDEAKAYAAASPEFGEILALCDEPHRQLHSSAKLIDSHLSGGAVGKAATVYRTRTTAALEKVSSLFMRAIEMEEASATAQLEAKRIFSEKTLPALGETGALLQQAKTRSVELLEGEAEANRIYASVTAPVLKKVQSLLGSIIGEVNGNVMTDEQMLAAAGSTRNMVLILCAAAFPLGLFLAWILARGITRAASQGEDFALKMSRGDLTGNITVESRDEIGMLAAAMRSMKAQLSKVVTDVHSVASSVTQGSDALNESAQQMSQGANEQAASIEEVSSSMEQMKSNINQSAENAVTTEKLAVQAAMDAQEGGVQVNNTVDAMRNIAEKTGIIEEIARQTNLLALNAAIEAARAGEAGKGFAVVASEVRKLAERSQVAAGEIGQLSSSSVEIAENAGGMLQKIVPDIKRTSELVQEIASSAREQSEGADQINRAVQQLDSVIQQNTAASEEMASTSEELNLQAEQLMAAVSFFSMNGNGHSADEVEVLPAPEGKLLEDRRKGV